MTSESDKAELETISEEIRDYVNEKDGIKAMVSWVKIQKRINALRKATIQSF
jgi:hypothetical protein